MTAVVTEEIRLRAREEAQALLAAIRAGEPAPPRRVPAKRTSRPSRATGAPKTGRPPVYDRAKILEFRESGMLISDIASALGCAPQSVRTALRQANAYVPDPPKKKHRRTREDDCKRGHSLKDAWESKSGYLTCNTCRRMNYNNSD